MELPRLIEGSNYLDERGTLSFVNDFSMKEVQRFYVIKHPNTHITRGWRAHKMEQRWFYVTKGAFEIKLIAIDNWEVPNPELAQTVFNLKEESSNVLHVPKGYATCLRALSNDSQVIVYADYDIIHAKNDEYVYPLTYFK